MTRGDGIIIGLVLALSVAAFPLAASAQASSAGITIRGPHGTTKLPTAEERNVRIEGTRGSLTVQVSGGRARVLEADCPDQVCVHSGWSAAGRPVVCAPNRVVIESGGGGGLDAVSR